MYNWNDIIRKIRKTQKQLRFAFACFPHGDDDRYVDSVNKIGIEYNVVSIEKQEGKDAQIVYHIFMEPSGAGFFADFNKLLAYLYFADQMNLIPVVEFSEESRYAEDHPVNGTTNPFEYYFDQPGDIKLQDIRNYGCVVKSKRENVILANNLNDQKGGYTKTERHLDEMGRIFEKYIRVNSTVRNLLHEDWKKLGTMEGKILGVHVRGTDFKWNYNGHPIIVSPEEYLKKAEDIYGEGNYNHIFLATDDKSALKLFQDRFGEKLCFYQDATRDDGMESVMNSASSRPNHHYLLGYEVLRDMYTLASCDGLVAGLSQVSYAARICKRSRNEKYDIEMILNKGINYHKRYNCPNERRGSVDGR